MDELTQLKNELKKLKQEQTTEQQKRNLKQEIHKLKAQKKSEEYRKKHPVMYGIAQASIRIGKNITTDTPEKRAKAKRANEQLKEMLKW